MRRLVLYSAAVLLAAGVAMPFSGCGGGGSDPATTSTTSAAPFGGGVTPPPGESGGAGDPITSCMAAKGFTLNSPADVPSLSAQGRAALQQCLQSVMGPGAQIP
jgi:hypothetical protein